MFEFIKYPLWIIAGFVQVICIAAPVYGVVRLLQWWGIL